MSLSNICAPLFVPASKPERFSKAVASGADAIILDLEDSIAPLDKGLARNALASDFTDLPVIVRINGANTQYHTDDIAAVRRLRPAGLMLPKAEERVTLAQVVADLQGRVPVIALIETARGLAQARELAAIPGVARLAFGSIDFCADLGCAHLREVLLPARLELVLASRLAGIVGPLDGVTVALNDADMIGSDARHARQLGMMGKLCIHPRQVPEVKRAFTHTEAEVAWARRVLESRDGVATVDGEMVDEPVRQLARTILARADR